MPQPSHDWDASNFRELTVGANPVDQAKLVAAELGERPREVYGYDLLLLRPDMHVVWRGNTLRNAAALARTATGH